MIKKLLFFALLTLGGYAYAQPCKTQNLILITIDGFRWKEVFTGADSALLNNPDLVKNTDAYVQKYWNVNAERRRSILMPFMWKTISKNGQIYGNRSKGCNVNVANQYWFSYPGYSEILCGFADNTINSNSFGPNPNTNVLDFINRNQKFTGQVAAFSSWDAFSNILNKDRSHILVNTAFDNVDESAASPQFHLLNKMQSQFPDVIPGVRLDALTFNLGFEYLKAKHPRVLYLAFDETDDFAHDGRYDDYLNSAHYTDNFIQELWQWIQNQEDYRDKTTLFITVDHGRGMGEPAWRDHGRDTKHSDETWFAVMGPDTPPLGEITSGQYYNEQYAKTLALLLGLSYENEKTVGAVIRQTMEHKLLVNR